VPGTIVPTSGRISMLASPVGPGSIVITLAVFRGGWNESRNSLVKNGGAVTPLGAGQRQNVASRIVSRSGSAHTYLARRSPYRGKQSRSDTRLGVMTTDSRGMKPGRSSSIERAASRFHSPVFSPVYAAGDNGSGTPELRPRVRPGLSQHPNRNGPRTQLQRSVLIKACLPSARVFQKAFPKTSGKTGAGGVSRSTKIRIK
jgi:hypothetical protein